MTTPDAPLGIAATPRKWTLHDPVTGGETYVLEIGPFSMTSPHPAKTLTTESTTARDGQALTWEGARRAPLWRLRGTLISRAQREAMERFQALNRRVWIIDHLARAWVVSIETFEPVPRRSTNFPHLHDWQMGLVIYAGPVAA